MAIRDDGSGFDPDVKQTGIGLQGIYQRGRVINARVEVIAAPGGGKKKPSLSALS